MKRTLKYAISWLEDLLLLVLTSDLLYLYYIGAWSDPLKAVELAEVVILWAIIPFALWRLTKHVKEAFHEQSSKG